MRKQTGRIYKVLTFCIRKKLHALSMRFHSTKLKMKFELFLPSASGVYSNNCKPGDKATWKEYARYKFFISFIKSIYHDKVLIYNFFKHLNKIYHPRELGEAI